MVVLLIYSLDQRPLNAAERQRLNVLKRLVPYLFIKVEGGRALMIGAVGGTPAQKAIEKEIQDLLQRKIFNGNAV